MLRKGWTGLMAGAAFALATAIPAIASAEELTIFWAEWDPANYLQELVNQYTAETGVTVTVQDVRSNERAQRLDVRVMAVPAVPGAAGGTAPGVAGVPASV